VLPELLVRALQVCVAALELLPGACVHALFSHFMVPILRFPAAADCAPDQLTPA
jgi:hypothetical protein